MSKGTEESVEQPVSRKASAIVWLGLKTGSAWQGVAHERGEAGYVWKGKVLLSLQLGQHLHLNITELGFLYRSLLL